MKMRTWASWGGTSGRKIVKGKDTFSLPWVVEVQLWKLSSLCFCVASVADKRPQLLPSGTSLQHVQCHFCRRSEICLRGLPWASNAIAVQQTQSLRYFLCVCVCVCVWCDIYLHQEKTCEKFIPYGMSSYPVQKWYNFIPSNCHFIPN